MLVYSTNKEVQSSILKKEYVSKSKKMTDIELIMSEILLCEKKRQI